MTPWHQGLIRKGVEMKGYWEIEVEEAGLYEFSLMRWPVEEERSLLSGIGEDRSFLKEKNRAYQDSCHYWYTGGEALSLKHAQVTITSENNT